MKYKALLLDIDGTLIPYEYNALPSQKVKDAIKKACDQGIIVCLVTGRAYESTKHILDFLELHDGVVVTNAGAGVFDIKTSTPLYVQFMETEDVDFVMNLLKKEQLEFYVKNGMYDGANKGPYKEGDLHNEVTMIFANEDYSDAKIDKIHEIISKRKNTTFYKTKHRNPKKAGLNVSHVNATKLHGVEIIMKHYNLERQDIIAAGDAYNDFPLLMSSGFKVAMGNAIPELKEIADYIAPSVNDDGVADIIEKFVLSPNS